MATDHPLLNYDFGNPINHEVFTWLKSHTGEDLEGMIGEAMKGVEKVFGDNHDQCLSGHVVGRLAGHLEKMAEPLTYIDILSVPKDDTGKVFCIAIARMALALIDWRIVAEAILRESPHWSEFAAGTEAE